jgi:hypothetical protein
VLDIGATLGLAARELAVETERLGVEQEVEQHKLQPDGVGREVAEREVLQAAVLGGANAVLDPGALAVTVLQRGDVVVGLVGEDGLEAVAVGVGERELRAGMRGARGGRARASRSASRTGRGGR